jgi:methionyl-tRNA formyltransferase
MVERLRIVFFGTPAFAVPSLGALLESRHPVVALVSQPDRPKGRGQKLLPTPTKELALSRSVPVLQPLKLRDEAFLRAVETARPDLGIVAAYGRILPERLLQIPRLGMINVHASLLPRYRGAAPVHRAVIDGEPETGVTIMRVVAALDAGPTFASVRRPIGPDDTSVEVEADLARLGADLLLEIVEALAGGGAIEVPQDEANATYAPKVTKEEGMIDWTLPAARLHNLVRGLQPWPLVSASFGGVRARIRRTAVTAEPTSAAPASVTSADGDAIAVAAGDGRILHILELQPEGRRAMTAREFLAGHRIEPGTRLRS